MRPQSCAHPPFWDQLNGSHEAFQRQLERLIRLRSLEHLEGCECLEDLLAAVYERYAEILRVTAYQILLALPPIGRRGAFTALGEMDPCVVRKVLSEITLESHVEALEESGWPRGGKEWVVKASPRLWPLGMAIEDIRTPPGNGPVSFGPKTMRFLQEVVQGLAKAESLLPVPTDWIGSSCLDLRIDHLSGLAADHLAKWPDLKDLDTALAGLSPANKDKVRGLFPMEEV